MPTPRHTPSSSRSGALPARYTVPPLPPQIHRRLLLSIQDDGVLLRPKAGDGEQKVGVRLSWGVRGKVDQWDDEGQDEDDTVELGGILGVVRLWDAAYLLVFLPSTKPPSPLFTNHVEATPCDAELDREARASSHRVFTLSDVHALPLVQDLAQKALLHLQSIQRKRTPKPPPTPSKARKLKWDFTIPGFNISGPGTVATNDVLDTLESSEDESDDDGTNHGGDELSDQRSRGSTAPEADETPNIHPTTAPSEDRAKKRFSLGWGQFMPKLGKSKQDPVGGSEEAVLAEESADLLKGDDAAVPPEKAPGGLPPPFPTNPPQRRELESKILRQIIREFTSGAFFYSFDFDLTHSLQHKRRILTARAQSGPALANLLSKAPTPTIFPQSSPPAFPTDSPKDPVSEDDFVEPDVQVPLWRRVDRRFFWNEWLLKDFLELGLHSYIIPVLQGWVQSSTFTIPVPPNPLDPSVSLGVVPVDLVVISRRSKDRAGLRYQRRGIDDEGHVANFVETEMIVRAKVEGKVSLFSFTQIRGSIPLKWSQSPYSMKPPPVLDQPVDQAFSVANLHFNDLTHRYGQITVVNLSEQTGKEGVVTNGYKDLIHSLNRKDVTYKDFDFHAKCHGMKWEHISELVGELDFGNMGYLWTLQGDAIREQTGIFRTNCIDCLDRTNVVQSAFARHVLTNMLTQLGLTPDANTSRIEAVFNDVWANNGDTLSLCYAHTSALKGDFVRTGKRDFSGMLHDGVSSVSRMFYGAVSDFFAQAVISFLLGHRNLGVFSEFLENLQSSEESNLLKLSRVRAAAIETSSARVLDDGERRIAGWTLLSPEDRNTKLSPKLEEKVLLLTKLAVYVVSFNYSLEKVVGFTRIPLVSITSIQKGAYILSTLQEAARDPVENAGFMINFSPVNEDTRYSTYSIRNKATPSSPNPGSPMPGTPIPHIEHAAVDPLSAEFFALKVLPREFPHGEDDEEDGETCKVVVDKIVQRVQDQCKVEPEIIEKDVVSLTDAQQSTTLLARMDYAVKRFLWL